MVCHVYVFLIFQQALEYVHVQGCVCLCSKLGCFLLRPHEKILEAVLRSHVFPAFLRAMDSSLINDGALLSESVAIQTTVMTPQHSDRRTTTVNITTQSLEARRRRVGTPGRPNLETPQNVAANLERVGAALDPRIPQPQRLRTWLPSVWARPQPCQHHAFALHKVASQRRGGADLDGRQIYRASGIMSMPSCWGNFPVFRQRIG